MVAGHGHSLVAVSSSYSLAEVLRLHTTVASLVMVPKVSNQAQ